MAPSSSSYYITRISDRRLAEIDWPARKSCAWFKYTIRCALDIDSTDTFLLTDADGSVCVVSPSLPPGRYSLIETPCVETVHSLAARTELHAASAPPRAWHDENDNDDLKDDDEGGQGESQPLRTPRRHAPGDSTERDAEPCSSEESFERNLLQLAMADALIANERTYLAWMRTSLAVMICCFSFAFLDNWADRSDVAKVRLVCVCSLFLLPSLSF